MESVEGAASVEVGVSVPAVEGGLVEDDEAGASVPGGAVDPVSGWDAGEEHAATTRASAKTSGRRFIVHTLPARLNYE